MKRRRIDINVFEAAVQRMVEIYEQGHRVVVSFSGGKDSGICVEVCLLAAKQTGRLPVEVIMRDEEIMFPGTFEYAERIAARPDISFHWIYARQPVINVFNREMPYFWVFDPWLAPDQWVRQPPAQAYEIQEKDISRMTIPERFPPDPGKNLYTVIGLRTSESRGRMYGLFSSKGYVTKPNKYGVYNSRPIYDWGDGDVWKAIKDNEWDYNSAYDTMARLGIKRTHLRIAPPTMNTASVRHLGVARQAWPQWFDRVCDRLPGVRSAASFGVRSVLPTRYLQETWEDCFHRTCIDTAPAWIAERAQQIKDKMLHMHARHSSTPFPEVDPCYHCVNNLGSWKRMAEAMYTGDPFSIKCSGALPYVEPEYFREGAGTWGGVPAFA